MNATDIKTQVATLLTQNNITMKTVFVPWSQSRNKSEKHPSFNYLVTILKNDKEVLTTEYMMGGAHTPTYKKIKTGTVYGRKRIKEECEKGYQIADDVSGYFNLPLVVRGRKQHILPDITDVFYSLLLDSNVLDYPTFESWADDFGYEADSRKAEKTYNECLAIALKLRAAIGDDLRAELQELLQDY